MKANYSIDYNHICNQLHPTAWRDYAGGSGIVLPLQGNTEVRRGLLREDQG
jgi:hypothetical protein